MIVTEPIVLFTLPTLVIVEAEVIVHAALSPSASVADVNVPFVSAVPSYVFESLLAVIVTASGEILTT